MGNDASLDVDGAMPDIKVMDSGINMTGNEVSALSSSSLSLSQTDDSGGLTDRDRERVAEKARARVACTRQAFLYIDMSKVCFKMVFQLRG